MKTVAVTVLTFDPAGIHRIVEHTSVAAFILFLSQKTSWADEAASTVQSGNQHATHDHDLVELQRANFLVGHVYGSITHAYNEWSAHPFSSRGTTCPRRAGGSSSPNPPHA